VSYDQIDFSESGIVSIDSFPLRTGQSHRIDIDFRDRCVLQCGLGDISLEELRI
jgi:hypothetical protein